MRSNNRMIIAVWLTEMAELADDIAKRMGAESKAKDGQLFIQHASELRGAAQMAREWAKEIREWK
jgi:dephospho-CoA kinase